MSRAPTASVLVDGHVHFHPCFDRDRFFTAACENFAAAARRLGLDGPPTGILLFTESAGDHYYRAFADRAGQAGSAWDIRHTQESSALVVSQGDRGRLFLVAGRQIVTAENLEVLALGCDAEFDEGRPIRDTLATVRDSGALTAVPWGFGKWWFDRGKLVAGLLDEQQPSQLFLGDNGGRLRWGQRPKLFREAEHRGFRILPGTDPLPFPNQGQRVGSYGFRLPGALDPERPAESLKRILYDLETAPAPYGLGERLVPFVRNQLAMQLRKRSARAAA